MKNCQSIETARLRLRQWKPADLAPFAELNASSIVMKYFPRTLGQDESDALANRFKLLIEANGWGMWALERKVDGLFMGFVGLHQPSYLLPVSPCFEIGWRLGVEYWGQGYATEAASAALAFGFGELALEDIYSFTAKRNIKSIAVMRRLKMENTGGNFNHPLVSVDSSLSEHVLYHIDYDTWSQSKINTKL